MDFKNSNGFLKPKFFPKGVPGHTLPGAVPAGRQGRQALSMTSPAKVNLTLDVLEREASGYHRILTIYHEVPSLADELVFTPLDSSQTILECENHEVPLDSSNTIHRAVELLRRTHDVSHGIHIHLTKRIPISSGLGGGSSNAATTLKALNELWELNLSVRELIPLAAEIGMDVPFFIVGGAALGMHYGEHLMPLPTLNNHRIEIISTNFPVSTREAYAKLSLEHCGKRVGDTLKLQRILKGELEWNESIESLLHNDFEAEFFKKYPELREQYPDAHLSGSGGSLYNLLRI